MRPALHRGLLLTVAVVRVGVRRCARPRPGPGSAARTGDDARPGGLGIRPPDRLRHGHDARLAGRVRRVGRPRLPGLRPQVPQAARHRRRSGCTPSPATPGWPTARPAWSSWSASREGNTGTAIGFHSIPTKHGQAIQSVSALGAPASHGCVRQSHDNAEFLFSWAPEGTLVNVIDTTGRRAGRRRPTQLPEGTPSDDGAGARDDDAARWSSGWPRSRTRPPVASLG